MRTRALSAVLAGLGVMVMVSGCSLLNPGTPRDDDGHVTESATISARDLQEADCFTFNSADGGIVAEVTVMPCVLEHDYIVIGQGTLTATGVAAAGSLQNAVSVACAVPFEAFKAGTKGDMRPKQEFLVFAETDETDADHLYSCISTDPDQAATESAPAP